MTLIVGIEHQGAVYMAADSGGWNSYEAAIQSGKIHHVGQLVIGCSGTRRASNVIRYQMGEVPVIPVGENPEAYLVRQAVPYMRDVFRANGVLTQSESGEGSGAHLLVACAGELFQISGALCVTRTTRPYAAAGHDGAVGVALGVLHATAHLVPETRLRLALEAAFEHTDAVRAPWRFEVQESAYAAAVAA